VTAAIKESIPDVIVVPPSPTIETKRVGLTKRRVAFALLGVAAFVVAFLVFLFFLSPIVAARQQATLATEFKEISNGGVASTLEWQPAKGEPVAILIIPRLALEKVVIEGTTATATTAGPGHFAASSLPGRPGNSVIIGRRTSFGGPFRNLSRLSKGDDIVVTTGVGEFTYEVTKLVTVPEGSEDIIGPSTDNTLTLVTAEPAYTVSGRLAVVAKLDGDPAAAPTNPPALINASETGMGGDPSAFPPLLLWGELLIVAVLATIWLWRNITVRVAWLLGAPLVLALSWATFLGLARLLPSTL
jgi:sortase A